EKQLLLMRRDMRFELGDEKDQESSGQPSDRQSGNTVSKPERCMKHVDQLVNDGHLGLNCCGPPTKGLPRSRSHILARISPRGFEIGRVEKNRGVGEKPLRLEGNGNILETNMG
ncbi:hypothetical protein Ancab_019916, partial [Ancistrocladus abbreviatus]